MSQIIYKAFKTRIYPTEEQIIYFNKCFGVSRFAYNWFLNEQKINYKNNTQMSWKQSRDKFMNYRNQIPWIFEIKSRVYRYAQGDLMEAYDRFFKGKSNQPKFKSKKKKNKQSFSTDICKILNKNLFYIVGSNFNNKGYKNNRIKIKTSEDISWLKNIFKIIISKQNNIYYVSFNYKEIVEEKDLYQNNFTKTVGIDLGLKTFATQSDNKITKLPKQKIIKIENKIKVFQRVLSKKQRGSKNYYKVKTKLNKCYQKITNIKTDFLHKYTTWLCKNYKIIKIEDLNISGWLKNHKLTKSTSRSSLGTFRSMLNYKTQWYDSNLIIIDKWYASSKICSKCGNKKDKLKLSERVYICDKCELKMDRDLNAAINISLFK